MTDKVEISAVHLSTVGDRVIVAVEIEGRWVEVISEHKENAYSHIVEAHGIERCRDQQAGGMASGPTSRPSLQTRRALRGELGSHGR